MCSCDYLENKRKSKTEDDNIIMVSVGDELPAGIVGKRGFHSFLVYVCCQERDQKGRKITRQVHRFVIICTGAKDSSEIVLLFAHQALDKPTVKEKRGSS